MDLNEIVGKKIFKCEKVNLMMCGRESKKKTVFSFYFGSVAQIVKPPSAALQALFSCFLFLRGHVKLPSDLSLLPLFKQKSSAPPPGTLSLWQLFEV